MRARTILIIVAAIMATHITIIAIINAVLHGLGA